MSVLSTTAPYHVTGAITPDATCNYEQGGYLNSKPYYFRITGGWFIWWSPGDASWAISDVLGVAGGSFWVRNNPAVAGAYIPFGGAVGNATVVAGSH
jgi:hypothetical protein